MAQGADDVDTGFGSAFSEGVDSAMFDLRRKAFNKQLRELTCLMGHSGAVNTAGSSDSAQDGFSPFGPAGDPLDSFPWSLINC
jgi:hypothetical protein